MLSGLGAGVDRSQSTNVPFIIYLTKTRGTPRARRSGPGLTGDRMCLPLVGFADSGISLENGVYAAAVVPGSPAAKEGSLAVGDRIVAVSLRARAVCPTWTVR